LGDVPASFWFVMYFAPLGLGCMAVDWNRALPYPGI
jgi:hypothetical protein